MGPDCASGGVCDRSDAVEAAILAMARRAAGDDALACGEITPAMLAALRGRLDVSAQVAAHGRMTELKAGDFAWLAG